MSQWKYLYMRENGRASRDYYYKVGDASLRLRVTTTGPISPQILNDYKPDKAMLNEIRADIRAREVKERD